MKPQFKERLNEMTAESRAMEAEKKKQNDDLENVDYVVLDKGKEVHRSKSFEQAKSIARNIRGQIFWLMEGSFVNEIKF